MIVSVNRLFNQATFYDALSAQLAAVTKEVDGISKDQFLANSDEQIILTAFIRKWQLLL